MLPAPAPCEPTAGQSRALLFPFKRHIEHFNLLVLPRTSRLLVYFSLFDSLSTMNMIPIPTLFCTVKVELYDNHGSSKKLSFDKNGKLQIARNECRELFIKASEEQSSKQCACQLSSKDVQNVRVHSSFVKDGKASVVITTVDGRRSQFTISNCPPGELKLFLNALSVKNAIQNNRENTRGLSLKRVAVDERISPLTSNDLKRARTVLGDATNTPTGSSPKSRGVKAAPKSLKLIKPHTSPKLKNTLNLSISDYFKTATLTAEQRVVAQAALEGRLSIFFTGAAGTGKSHLLRYITERLPPETSVVAASTGVAASHINGVTLHTFAGVGAARDAAPALIAKVTANAQLIASWRRVKVLIVDEISMVDGELFDKLEEIARVVRDNDQPFGGIQLILCGDFLQLPPVTKPGEKKVYAFQAKSWERCVTKSFCLRSIHRQREPEFVQLLNHIRRGLCDDAVIERLKQTSQNKVDSDGILATRLCTHKVNYNV